MSNNNVPSERKLGRASWYAGRRKFPRRLRADQRFESGAIGIVTGELCSNAYDTVGEPMPRTGKNRPKRHWGAIGDGGPRCDERDLQTPRSAITAMVVVDRFEGAKMSLETHHRPPTSPTRRDGDLPCTSSPVGILSWSSWAQLACFKYIEVDDSSNCQRSGN